MPTTEIQVYSGIAFDPISPDPDKIDIGDIAHALSNNCRFTGHTTPFYCVAQHCVLASFYAPVEHQFTALMHDASEGLGLPDVASPIKEAAFGKIYREVEDKLMRAVSARFGNEWPVPPEVKEVDRRMLATEVRDLMSEMEAEEYARLWDPWLADIEPFEYVISPIVPFEAEIAFLKRFEELGGVQ